MTARAMSDEEVDAAVREAWSSWMSEAGFVPYDEPPSGWERAIYRAAYRAAAEACARACEVCLHTVPHTGGDDLDRIARYSNSTVHRCSAACRKVGEA